MAPGRKTGGRKKGTPNKHSKQLKRIVEGVVEGTLQDFQRTTRAYFGPLIAAQMELAKGAMVIARRIDGQYVEVKKVEDVIPLLNSGPPGEAYVIFTKPPQQAALSYVWDRLFGPISQTSVKAGLEAADGSRFVIEIKQTGQPAEEIEI